MLAISNTGPLIHLAKLGELGLLKQIFDTVYITRAVFEEAFIVGKEKGYEDAKIIEDSIDEGWIVVIPHNPDPDIKRQGILYGLGKGEIEAISLARLTKGLLLIDDKRAREFTVRYGIPVMGTIGIIIHATKIRVLPKKQAIETLKKLPNIMFISEKLIDDIIEKHLAEDNL